MKAIQVKRLPATDTKPNRWKAIAEGVPHKIFGTYDTTPREAAEALCEEHGWGKDLIHGDLPNGDHVFVFAPRDLVPVLKCALNEVDRFSPRGSELGGPHADDLRARLSALIKGLTGEGAAK